MIETDGARHYAINAGTVERYHDLARVEIGAGEGGRALISIACCTRAGRTPWEVRLMERHCLGSQAFIPLDPQPFVVVVAPAGAGVEPDRVCAFLSDGRQGVNYHPGTWHMPLMAFVAGQRFLVVDRGGPGEDCEELRLQPAPVLVGV